MGVKKNILYLISCIFLILFIGGIILFSFKGSSKSGVLKMNAVDIAQENVTIHSNYAKLPLTEVMKSLGMSVNWVDNNIAEITNKDKKYTLNLSKVSLTEAGQDFNLLLPPPGGNRFYTVLEKELVLDSNTIKSTMYQMGIKINVNINPKEQTVYIDIMD